MNISQGVVNKNDPKLTQSVQKNESKETESPAFKTYDQLPQTKANLKITTVSKDNEKIPDHSENSAASTVETQSPDLLNEPPSPKNGIKNQALIKLKSPDDKKLEKEEHELSDKQEEDTKEKEEEKIDKTKESKKASDTSSNQDLIVDSAIKNIYFVVNCTIESKIGQDPREEIEKILKKMKEEGCRDEHKKIALKNIRVVFGLNRQRTHFLETWEQIDKNIESEIEFDIITFFWDSRGKKNKTPMREIRQEILGSDATKNFFAKIRTDHPQSTIYFMTIDSDTVHFNQVFSSYIDYILKCSQLPAVMTTGYEFDKNAKTEKSEMAWFSSIIDRVVRLSTTRVIPWGAYFPEPNLCILVENLPFKEEFCSKKNGRYDWNESNCSLEAPEILRQVSQRENNGFVFLDKPPLITTIPPEVTKKLQREKTVKRLRQNHFHPQNWAEGLFWNRRDNIGGNWKHITGKLKTFFKTLDAQDILENKSWDPTNFENHDFSKIIKDSCENLDDIVTAARISQIHALLTLLAFDYPLIKTLEHQIISSEGILFFLAFYLMEVFKDEDLLRKYAKLIKEDFESLKGRIQTQQAQFGKLPLAQNTKGQKSVDIEYQEIIEKMLDAKSPSTSKSNENQI